MQGGMKRSRFGLKLTILGACFAFCLTLLLLVSGQAEAHHGGNGDYDASRPVYVEGTVEETDYGYPHALIDLDVPDGIEAPENPPDAADLRGYEDWEELTAVEGGSHELLLPPDITIEISGMDDRPEVGDEVSAITYRECDTGELRVQQIEFSGERLAYGSTIAHFVDGCPDEGNAGAATGDEAGGSGAEADPATDSTEGSPVGVFGIVAVVLVVGAAGYVMLGGRRSTGSLGGSPREDPRD